MKKIILFAVILLFFTVLSAQKLSPVGAWKTIDDVTGKPKSIVRLWTEDGILYGKVEKLFRAPDEEQNPVCDKCKGDKKNKPIIGLTILWDMKQKGDVWKSGKILDPKNGKIYGCKMQLLDNGNKLKVRGFLGISAFGRSQVWERVE
jgi:uncharacterized protein (DUF2147 family)